MSFSSSACWKRFLPVGLMRSPITRTPSMRSGVTGVHTKLARSYSRSAGRLSFSASAVARMYSGVVPQQPPKIVTTRSAKSATSAAKRSALIL